jgi:hypothetical protein
MGNRRRTEMPDLTLDLHMLRSWLACWRGVMQRSVLSTVLALPALAPAAVLAKDIAAARDHPLVGRYQGSEISFYATSEFDEAWLLKAPLDYAAISANRVSEHGGPEWLRLQGRVTQIRYDGPPGRSSLEIMANLHAGLEARGFETLFDCADATCFAGNQEASYVLGWQLDNPQQNGRYADHARYALASRNRPEGMIYVALLVGEASMGPTVFLRIVELKPMDVGKIVFVDADAMQKSIATSGRVALYGLFFDTNRDTLKPDSKPTLEQIARLLKSNPGLKLIVTGHTDNQGEFAYNVELSKRRAAAVVSALTADLASPAAPNTTDEGRSKNRRVELVEK